MASYNGSGVWSRLYGPTGWVTDKNNGVNIDSTRMDSEWSEITSGFNTAFCRDGQAVATGAWNMGGFGIANGAASTTRTGIPLLSQVQDGGSAYGTSVSGTNTIAFNLSPAITAYAPGAIYSFISAGANTGAVTVNINGVGAQALTDTAGTALAAGEIKSGMLCLIECKTATAFQLLNKFVLPTAGRLLAVQVFTASGTYTPNALTTAAIVRFCGGGGAGGGAAATTGQASVGSGGQAGGYVEFYWSAPSSQTVTIGAAGAGSSGAAGASGGNTSLGALGTANGGRGGAVVAAGTTVATATISSGAGSAPTSITNGTIISTLTGMMPAAPLRLGSDTGIATAGGSSPTGGGGIAFSQATGGNTSNTGNSATGFGAGGGGAGNFGTQTAVAGGPGTAGIMVIYEFT